MTNERFTCNDYPPSARMQELVCMYKTFDLRDKLAMLELIINNERIEVFIGTLGKRQITAKLGDVNLDGLCIEFFCENAFADGGLAADPWFKSAIDAHNAQEKARRKAERQAKK